MKKSIIAAGAASVALAAMPIVGVFAASNATVVDNVLLTVDNGCTITNASTTREVTIPAVVAGGEAHYNDGAGIELVCNAAGWTVAAQGTYTTTGTGAVATALNKLGTGDDATNVVATISTANSNAGEYSGNSSAWGFKVAVSTSGESPSADGTITTGYDNYKAVPSDSQTIVTGLHNAATITPSYKAYAASTQEPGAYAGQVTYTIAIANS